MATYGVASSYTLMMEPAQLMGAPLFETNGWAQSSPYPVSPFCSFLQLVGPDFWMVLPGPTCWRLQAKSTTRLGKEGKNTPGKKARKTAGIQWDQWGLVFKWSTFKWCVKWAHTSKQWCSQRKSVLVFLLFSGCQNHINITACNCEDITKEKW